MIKSMTGFGQKQYSENGYDVKIEVKSVNHRFLDVNIKMPRRYMLLEEKINQLIKNYAIRGHFDINVRIDMEQSSSAVKVDFELAKSYYESLQELAEILSLPFTLKVTDFMRMSDVISLEEPEENLDVVWAVLKPGFEASMEQLVQMRVFEGQKMQEDLEKRINIIEKIIGELEEYSPRVEASYRERLEQRLNQLLPQVDIDPQRIIQETAIFADKICIAEEITRFRSHIEQFRKILSAGDTAIGRKIDFLLQEMNREINTTASKANSAEMAALVVNVKSELEKIREQVQNVE